jgi:hypothetical protein
MDAVLKDNPQLCFSSVTDTELLISDKEISFRPEWMYAPEEVRQLRVDLSAAADNILARISSGASDYEKEKFLHDYFVRELRYQDCTKKDAIGHHEAHTAIGRCFAAKASVRVTPKQ